MNKRVRKEIILNYIKDNNLTKQEFCKKCHIGAGNLSSLLCNKQVSVRAVFNISREIGVSMADIFDNSPIVNENL